MTQYTDYRVQNQSGIGLRSDLNNNIQDILTCNTCPRAPTGSELRPGFLWFNSSSRTIEGIPGNTLSVCVSVVNEGQDNATGVWSLSAPPGTQEQSAGALGPGSFNRHDGVVSPDDPGGEIFYNSSADRLEFTYQLPDRWVGRASFPVGSSQTKSVGNSQDAAGYVVSKNSYNGSTDTWTTGARLASATPALAPGQPGDLGNSRRTTRLSSLGGHSINKVLYIGSGETFPLAETLPPVAVPVSSTGSPTDALIVLAPYFRIEDGDYFYSGFSSPSQDLYRVEVDPLTRLEEPVLIDNGSTYSLTTTSPLFLAGQYRGLGGTTNSAIMVGGATIEVGDLTSSSIVFSTRSVVLTGTNDCQVRSGSVWSAIATLTAAVGIYRNSLTASSSSSARSVAGYVGRLAGVFGTIFNPINTNSIYNGTSWTNQAVAPYGSVTDPTLTGSVNDCFMSGGSGGQPGGQIFSEDWCFRFDGTAWSEQPRCPRAHQSAGGVESSGSGGTMIFGGVFAGNQGSYELLVNTQTVDLAFRSPQLIPIET